MPRTSGLREQKQSRVRRQIFEAALDLFTRKGYEATSVEEIAAAAGVSRATYFNHFGTKEGVLRYFGEEMMARLLETAARVPPDATPLDRIRALLLAWSGYVTENRERVRLVFFYSLRDPHYLSGLTAARRQGLELVTGLIRQGQAAGQIRPDVPADHLALYLLAAYQNGLLYHLITEEPLAPLLESAWKFITGGIVHADSEAT